MKPAVTVLPESYSPTRLIVPLGATLAAERQGAWVRFHALVTAPAHGRDGNAVRTERAAEAIFSEKCRAICLSEGGDAGAAASRSPAR